MLGNFIKSLKRKSDSFLFKPAVQPDLNSLIEPMIGTAYRLSSKSGESLVTNNFVVRQTKYWLVMHHETLVFNYLMQAT